MGKRKSPPRPPGRPHFENVQLECAYSELEKIEKFGRREDWTIRASNFRKCLGPRVSVVSFLVKPPYFISQCHFERNRVTWGGIRRVAAFPEIRGRGKDGGEWILLFLFQAERKKQNGGSIAKNEAREHMLVYSKNH